MGKRGGKQAPRAAGKPAPRAEDEKSMLPEECGDDQAAIIAAGDEFRSPISAIAAETPRWVDVACEAAETSIGGQRTVSGQGAQGTVVK